MTSVSEVEVSVRAREHREKTTEKNSGTMGATGDFSKTNEISFDLSLEKRMGRLKNMSFFSAIGLALSGLPQTYSVAQDRRGLTLFCNGLP
ncbi:hypothetical protein RJT34_06849 [Clitoria ternatea]|uniref:Uncharacterized protein n=1 Tax=Clitoria ternatea TaxID=43366 RepID=A0AAN9PTR5_CLITE